MKSRTHVGVVAVPTWSKMATISMAANNFRCKDCHKLGVLNPINRRTEAEIERILAAYRERPIMRGIARVFGISRNTLAKWLKKSPDAAGAAGNPPAR